MLRFHTIGDWSPAQVQVHWTDSSRAIVPDAEHIIHRAWSEALRRPGVRLFDGPLCRLEAWDSSESALRLTLSRTSYKTFLGTHLLEARLDQTYGAGIRANPVGVSPALVSSDGFLLFGRRNASVAYYPHRVHPFAGALEPREPLDVFEDVRRELREELGLGESDLGEMRCTGLVEESTLRQPELTFAVRCARTRREIESQIDAVEHGGSWSVPATRDALESALHQPEPFTPVAIATLLLWGRLSFGNAWFEHHAARFRATA